MPIYEFVCQDCGHEFERIQSWSDTTTPTCTACLGTNVLRNMSRPAVHFKGSGWYITDSKKGAKNGAGESRSSDPKAKGESKTEGSNETKVDATSGSGEKGGDSGGGASSDSGSDSAKVASGESKKESAPAAAATE